MKHPKRTRYQQGLVKLERAFSKLGLASRTEARALILDGKVKVGGRVCKNPELLVHPETVAIEVEGATKSKAETKTIAFYKPRNCVTTKRDEKGRKTVYDYLPKELHSLHPVGRLDYATTGLLIFTNDTKLSAFLTDPKNGIPRTYVVTVRGEVSDEELQKIKSGVLVDGEKLMPSKIEIRKRSGKETHLIVTLTEGKNREIRRLFLAFEHEVTSLKRITFGEAELGDLKVGETRPLAFESSTLRSK